MTKIGFACSILAIVAVATWAYNVNYETKTTLGRIDALRGEIGAEREHIQVLRVEWAWLNGPERLERLADAHIGTLGLQPLTPEAFGRTAAVPFQPDEEPVLDAGLIAGLIEAEPPTALAELVMAPAGMAMPLPRPVSWASR